MQDQETVKIQNGDYSYIFPQCSAFYTQIISPTCNWITEKLMPQWVLPDWISLAGLLAAFMSAALTMMPSQPLSCMPSSLQGFYIALVPYKYPLAAVAWIFYSFLDNLDGKQARKLNLSSEAGEFVDHSCDSIVVSFSILICQYCLTLHAFQACTSLILVLGGQIPFYLANWSHFVLHRLLIGAEFFGHVWISVDEFNFLFVPSILLIRAFRPDWFDIDMMNFQWIRVLHSYMRPQLQLVRQFLHIQTQICTFGMFAAIVGMLLCIIVIIRTIVCNYSSKHIAKLIPVGAHLLLILVFNPNPFLIVASFSVFTMELIALRFEEHMLQAIRLWWTIFLEAIFFLVIDLYGNDTPRNIFYNSFGSKPNKFFDLFLSKPRQVISRMEWFAIGFWTFNAIYHFLAHRYIINHGIRKFSENFNTSTELHSKIKSKKLETIAKPKVF